MANCQVESHAFRRRKGPLHQALAQRHSLQSAFFSQWQQRGMIHGERSGASSAWQQHKASARPREGGHAPVIVLGKAMLVLRSNTIPQHELLGGGMEAHLLVHPVGHRITVQVMLQQCQGLDSRHQPLAAVFSPADPVTTSHPPEPARGLCASSSRPSRAGTPPICRPQNTRTFRRSFALETQRSIGNCVSSLC